jgi:hypothetical protein
MTIPLRYVVRSSYQIDRREGQQVAVDFIGIGAKR